MSTADFISKTGLPSLIKQTPPSPILQTTTSTNNIQIKKPNKHKLRKLQLLKSIPIPKRQHQTELHVKTTFIIPNATITEFKQFLLQTQPHQLFINAERIQSSETITNFTSTTSSNNNNNSDSFNVKGSRRVLYTLPKDDGFSSTTTSASAKERQCGTILQELCVASEDTIEYFEWNFTDPHDRKFIQYIYNIITIKEVFIDSSTATTSDSEQEDGKDGSTSSHCKVEKLQGVQVEWSGFILPFNGWINRMVGNFILKSNLQDFHDRNVKHWKLIFQ